jgi:hypothetical protein
VVPIFTTDKINIISSLQGAKAAPSGPIRTNIPAPELIQLGFLRVFVLLRPGGENEGDAEAPLAIIRRNDCPFAGTLRLSGISELNDANANSDANANADSDADTDADSHAHTRQPAVHQPHHFHGSGESLFRFLFRTAVCVLGCKWLSFATLRRHTCDRIESQLCPQWHVNAAACVPRRH